MKTSTAVLLLLVVGFLCLSAAKPHNEGKRSHLAKKNREHKINNRMEHGEHHRREHGGVGQHTPGSPGQITRNRKDHLATASAPHRAELTSTQVGHKVGAAVSSSSSTKKELHLQHITEHNIDKKHGDKQQRGEAVAKHLVTNRVPSDSARHVLTNRTPQVVAETARNTTTATKTKNGSKDDIPMESEHLIHVTPRPPKAHRVNRMHHNRPSPPGGATSVAQRSSFHSGNTPAKAHKPPKKYSPKKHGWKKSQRKDKGKDKLKEKRERRDKRNKALHRAIANRKL